MTMTKRQLHACELIALILTLPGAGAGPAGSTGGGAEVVVHTVTPEPMRGEIVAFSLGDGLILQCAGEKRHIPTRDIIRITATAETGDLFASGGPATAQLRDGLTVTLLDGDTLRGRPAEARDDSVVIETEDLGLVLVPLEVVRGISTGRAGLPGYRESAEWLESAGPGEDDQVLLTNGDVLHGFVAGLDADGLLMDTRMGETKVPHRLVVAARLAGGAAKPLDTPYLVVTFRDSGRLTVTSLDWLESSVEVRLRYGTRLGLDAGRIRRVDVVGGRWEWLSAHGPISYEHAPMLSLDWDYRTDRNVLGRPMTVAGQRFERGIGVHSRSSLSFELKGLYREFVASLGLDDESGPLADVTALILVDGQRRFERAHLRRGTLVGPVRLDVSRANRLELIVDFGDNGDLQDRFDWVDAALIRVE